MSYNDLVEVRHIDIQGESDWTWVKSDTGAFGSSGNGPMRDWIEGHSKKYFDHVKNFNTVVTAGGNCGMYVRFYSKKFKYVYAFEPNPLSFHCMVLNNQVDNVIKLNAAVGDKPSLVDLDRKNLGNIGTHTIDLSGSTLRIPMLTIDSLGLDRCDLIQLDVEYYEYNALLGALETIKRCSPVIIAENGHVDQIVNLLEPLGYKIVDRTSYDTIWSKE